MNVVKNPETLSPKDYATDQEVRWCPGCGDYAILKAMQKTMAEMRAPREKTVFVSGIGCSSRFPYYMATYGFHTIHGRAPAFATGIKLANPELDVWVITGDGDGLSIGGNHLYHALRRNVDLQIVLFNNEIYGLTKGQYSPTSRRGTKSPSTPAGSIDNPVGVGSFALGCGAGFVARSIDTTQKHLAEVFRRARGHHGTSFVEIYQNCIVYNDDVFDSFTNREAAPEMQLLLEHGKPLIYGRDRDRGIRMKPGSVGLEAVTIGKKGVGTDDLVVHDERNRDLALLLASMQTPDMPVALGVLYCQPGPSYEVLARQQMDEAAAARPGADIDGLLRQGYTWTVQN